MKGEVWALQGIIPKFFLKIFFSIICVGEESITNFNPTNNSQCWDSPHWLILNFIEMITEKNAEGIITYSGEDIQDLMLVSSGNDYNVTDKTKPNFGKKFTRFTLNGKMFTVSEEHELIKLRNAKDLFMVKLKEKDFTRITTVVDDAGVEAKVESKDTSYEVTGVRGLSTSIALRRGTIELESITVDNYKPSTVAELETLD